MYHDIDEQETCCTSWRGSWSNE